MIGKKYLFKFCVFQLLLNMKNRDVECDYGVAPYFFNQILVSKTKMNGALNKKNILIRLMKPK